MADPLFDQINSTTLANLRDTIAFDDLFKDSPFLAKLRAKPTNRRKVIDRLIGMDISLERATELAQVMVDEGVIKDPDVEIEGPTLYWHGKEPVMPFIYSDSDLPPGEVHVISKKCHVKIENIEG